MDEGVDVVHEGLLTGTHTDAEAERVVGGPFDVDFEADLPTLETGGPADSADVGGGDGFEPDGLPDAGGAGIPDGVRFELPVLLAAGLFEIGGVVVGADDELLWAFTGEGVGDLDGEGSVAAFVPGDFYAIDPHIGGGVDCTEVQDDALSGFELGPVKLTAVPYGAEEAGVSDAAGGSFRGEGHLDAGVPRDLGEGVPLSVGIDSKVPFTVERGPLLALQLRSGIAGLRAQASVDRGKLHVVSRSGGRWCDLIGSILTLRGSVV